MNPFIGTLKGELDILAPQPEQITLEDIVYGLSHQCRYAGMVNTHYSVAEHSVLVADEVYRLTGSNQAALSGLMHDASEAYLPDIPKPYKALMPDYCSIEAGIQLAIERKWGIAPMCDVVKWVDDNIIKDETRRLYDNGVPDWAQGLEGTGIRINCWPYARSRMEFRERFKKYAAE